MREMLAVVDQPDSSVEIETIGELVVDQWGVPILIDEVEDFRLRPHRRTREQSEEAKKRLNEMRFELTHSSNPHDIINYFANRWGIGTLQTRKYLKTAKAMNRQILDLTPAEAKADSVSFWSLESQRLAKDRVKADSLLDEAGKLLNQAREAISKGIELGDSEYIEKSRATAQRARELMAASRSIKNAAIDRGHTVRDRLDRILGTLAPIKMDVAVTGNVDVTVRQEPITFEEIIKKLAQATIDNPALALDEMLYTEINRLRGNVIQGELSNVTTGIHT